MVDKVKEMDKSIEIDYTALKNDLFRHLNVFIKKNKVGFKEKENTLLSQIKTEYAECFKLAKSMYKVFQTEYELPYSDNEVSFITIYLYKNSSVKIKRIYKVIAVCGTGRGMSLLLKKRIENVFDNIEVLECYSSIQIHTLPNFDEVDFVISTVNLNLKEIDVIKVSAFLGNRDIRTIQEYINYGSSFNAIPVNMGWSESSELSLSGDLIHGFSTKYQKVFLRLFDSLMSLPSELEVDEQAILGITIHLIIAIPRIMENEYSEEGLEELNQIARDYPKAYKCMDEFFTYFESRMELRLDALEKFAIFQYIIRRDN